MIIRLVLSGKASFGSFQGSHAARDGRPVEAPWWLGGQEGAAQLHLQQIQAETSAPHFAYHPLCP